MILGTMFNVDVAGCSCGLAASSQLAPFEASVLCATSESKVDAVGEKTGPQ